MNKKDLVCKLSAKMQITQTRSNEFMNAFQKVLSESLKENETIQLQGFGAFGLWEQNERAGRNPRTGIPCMIPSRKSVKFKPGKDLLKVLNS